VTVALDGKRTVAGSGGRVRKRAPHRGSHADCLDCVWPPPSRAGVGRGRAEGYAFGGAHPSRGAPAAGLPAATGNCGPRIRPAAKNRHARAESLRWMDSLPRPVPSLRRRRRGPPPGTIQAHFLIGAGRPSDSPSGIPARRLLTASQPRRFRAQLPRSGLPRRPASARGERERADAMG